MTNKADRRALQVARRGAGIIAGVLVPTLGLGLMACGLGGSDISEMKLSALTVDVSEAEVVATLSWNTGAEGGGQAGGAGCPEASDSWRASYDGADLAAVSRGGWVETLGGKRCDNFASFKLNTHSDFSVAKPASRVEITDGHTTIAAVFQSLIAPRGLTVVGSDSVQAGGKATFQLTPATDEILAGDKLHWERSGGGVIQRSGVTIEGSRIEVDVPAEGAGQDLTFTFGRGQGVTKAGVISCDGVPLCQGIARPTPSVAVVHVQ